MAQLAGGVIAVQPKLITAEEDAVAVRPVGAAGTALQLEVVTVSTAVLLVMEPAALVTTTL
jgi:hypothetical protein